METGFSRHLFTRKNLKEEKWRKGIEIRRQHKKLDYVFFKQRRIEQRPVGAIQLHGRQRQRLTRRESCWIVSPDFRDNTHTLVNYGARWRKGLLISSSIAESAVNLVVSQHGKMRQMRWTDEGAHSLA